MIGNLCVLEYLIVSSLSASTSEHIHTYEIVEVRNEIKKSLHSYNLSEDD